MSSPVREKSRRSPPRCAGCTRMPSHFHSATKSAGIELGELFLLERMGQHQRPEDRRRPDIGPSDRCPQPGEQRPDRAAHAVPDLLDLGDGSTLTIRASAVLARRAETPTRKRAGDELEQGPAAGRHRSRSSQLAAGRELRSCRRASQPLHHIVKRGGGSTHRRRPARSAPWSRRCRRQSRGRGRTAPDRRAARSSRSGCGAAAAGRTSPSVSAASAQPRSGSGVAAK